MWLGPSDIAADFCPRRLLCRHCGVLLTGERLRGALSQGAARCSCPRRATHSSAKGTVVLFSPLRLSISQLNSFRNKARNNHCDNLL